MKKDNKKAEKETKEKKPPKEKKLKKEKTPKKGKKEKSTNNKKEKISKNKKPKGRIIIFAIVLLIFAGIYFLIFGGEKVPEKIKNIEAYSHVTEIIRNKTPEILQAPFNGNIKLPIDLNFKLPFSAPKIGESKPITETLIMEEIQKYKAEKGETVKEETSGEEEAESAHGESSSEEEKASEAEAAETENVDIPELSIEKRVEGKDGGSEIIYAMLQEEDEKGNLERKYYQLKYESGIIGGLKLKEILQYNVIGDSESPIGVDNKLVLEENDFFKDIPEDWERGELKVLGHYTDMKLGTDTVVVYMELKSDSVFMKGGKEIKYKYNYETEKWEKYGLVSEFHCVAMEKLE